MKFLVITRQREGVPNPENYVDLLKAAKEFINTKMADGSLDCVYQTISKIPGAAIAIANAESHEQLLSDLMAYPLFTLLKWKIKPLVDAIKLFDISIAALENS